MSISTRYLPVAIALSYLGATTRSEKHREIVRIFNSVKPQGYTLKMSDPWCAAFWTVCQILAGNSHADVPMSASCNQLIAEAKARGIWQEDESVAPKVGDGVMYDWQDGKNYAHTDDKGDADHIGLDYAVDKKYMYVVEGNKGYGVVGKRAVAINGQCLRGFIEPKYASMYKIQYVPTTSYKGSLPTGDVLYNKTGEDVKRLQTFLNWIDDAKLKVDGSCGAKTTQAILDFQYTYGLALDGCFGPACRAKAKALVKKYPLPDHGQKLGQKADELAYKTNAEEAKYPSGKPTAAYKAALDKVYPDRSRWGKAARDGASCDVFVGTVIRSAGIDKDFPRGLADQIPHLAKSKKFSEVKATTTSAKDGDIIVYTKVGGGAHICIVYKGRIKEASHEQFYPKTTPYLKQRLDKSGKKMLKVYRAR